MTPAMIAELARELVKEQVHQNLWFYVLWLALILLAAFFGSWVRGYATDAGKFAVIERNFEVVLEQLRKSTSATTQVQLALNHQDWSAREFKTVRREKLEVLLTSLLEVREWTYKMLFEKVEGNLAIEDSPINKFLAIGGLYFTELDEAIHRVYTAHHDFVIAMLSTVQPVWDANLEYEKLKIDFDANQALPNGGGADRAAQILPNMLAAQQTAATAAREYKLGLMPLQRNIQTECSATERDIKRLMAIIITPA